MKVAIIGGGAAGFFSAIQVAECYPNAHVAIFEKTSQLLSKVKISGGGRCNLSHVTETIKELAKAYPRGENQLKKVFGVFGNKEAIHWFEERGVPVVVQDDACVFPQSQNSQSVIDCLVGQAEMKAVVVKRKSKVTQIKPIDDAIELLFDSGNSLVFDKVIVTTGGSPKRMGLNWLEMLGHRIVSPVPSLFTFNMPSENTEKVMGIVVDHVVLSIQGTKLKSEGALLLTHWGMSGPAVLKLSSFGARILAEKQYNFKIQINWINQSNHDAIRQVLQKFVVQYPKKSLNKQNPFGLPTRLWEFLLNKHNISLDKKWNELGKKGLNKLIELLTNDIYQATGKTGFKEEFVTAGGVCVQDVDFKTMQSKLVKGLYFAGEVLDIDGITGGYNLQAAWSTAFIAGKLM